MCDSNRDVTCQGTAGGDGWARCLEDAVALKGCFGAMKNEHDFCLAMGGIEGHASPREVVRNNAQGLAASAPEGTWCLCDDGDHKIIETKATMGMGMLPSSRVSVDVSNLAVGTRARRPWRSRSSAILSKMWWKA